MDCAEVREEFSALLDGELDKETRTALEEHLAGCADCLRELDRLKQVDATFRRLAPKQAPEDFDERIRAAVQPNIVSFRPPRLARKRVWPLVASAAGLLIVLGVSVVQMRREPKRFEMASAQPAPEEKVLANDLDLLLEAEASAGAAPMRKGMAADEAAFGGEPEAQENVPAAPGAIAAGHASASEGGRTRMRATTPEPAAMSDDLSHGKQAPPEPSMELDIAAEHVLPMIAPDAAPPLLHSAPVMEATPRALSPARPPAQIAAKREMPAPAPRPKAASRDKDQPAPTVREAAGRTFEWRDGTWYEEGYRPESDADDLVTLVRGSAQFEELVKEYPKIADFAGVGERVVFRFQRKWWAVGAA